MYTCIIMYITVNDSVLQTILAHSVYMYVYRNVHKNSLFLEYVWGVKGPPILFSDLGYYVASC